MTGGSQLKNRIAKPALVAMALKYDPQKMAAPIVLAKGHDEVAQKIKKLAAEHNIPMVENVQLARALTEEISVGKPVLGKLYRVMVRVLKRQ